MGEWSTRRATILSTSALPALVTPMAIASVPKGSTDVMNVMPFILLGLKTIFYHHAKFHQKTPPKNAPTMTRSISRKIKNLCSNVIILQKVLSELYIMIYLFHFYIPYGCRQNSVKYPVK